MSDKQGSDIAETATARRAFTIADLFPPDGHRYMTEDELEALRVVAVTGQDMTLPGLTVLEMISDIRNLAADLEQAQIDGADS